MISFFYIPLLVLFLISQWKCASGFPDKSAGVLWQGRNQFFQASSHSLVYDDNGTEILWRGNDTSRTWPRCGNDCFQDEIRLPLQDDLAISIIYAPNRNSGVVVLGGDYKGYLNFNLVREFSDGTFAIQGFFKTSTHELFWTPNDEDYDGWSCDYVELQLGNYAYNEETGTWDTENWVNMTTWNATDVILGNFQEEGYCPVEERIYRPCASDEFCSIVNDKLTCTKVEVPGVAQARSASASGMQLDFDCTIPTPAPTSGASLLPLTATTGREDATGSIRFRQFQTFLQARSYEMTINEAGKDEGTTITFPHFPVGLYELSNSDYEIDNSWYEKDDSVVGGRIQRRLNMNFERKEFGPILTSSDGWTLRSLWIYDNLPDWTEWPKHESFQEEGFHHSDIQVPAGYSLFACEQVAFELESSYSGGSPAVVSFENLLLGAFLQPDYNVCDLKIYHPCRDNDDGGNICQAVNGKVQCVEGLVIDGVTMGEVDNATTVVARTPGLLPPPGQNDLGPNDWFTCQSSGVPSEDGSSGASSDENEAVSTGENLPETGDMTLDETSAYVGSRRCFPLVFASAAALLWNLV